MWLWSTIWVKSHFFHLLYFYVSWHLHRRLKTLCGKKDHVVTVFLWNKMCGRRDLKGQTVVDLHWSNLKCSSKKPVETNAPVLNKSRPKRKGMNEWVQVFRRVDQVKFVEDSLQKIWRDIFCLSRAYPFKFFKGCPPQILLCPLLHTLSQITFSLG